MVCQLKETITILHNVKHDVLLFLRDLFAITSLVAVGCPFILVQEGRDMTSLQLFDA